MWSADACPYCTNPAINLDRQDDCPYCHQGFLYREQVLAPGVKAKITRKTRRYVQADGEYVAAAEITIATMPDEIYLGHLDRVMLLEREEQSRLILLRGGDGYTPPEGIVPDHVPYLPLVRVTRVWNGAQVFTPVTDYGVDLSTGEIVWSASGAHPDPGDSYAAEYFYHPVYRFMGDDQKLPRATGMPGDGDTPLRGRLVWERPDDL